MSDTQPMDSIKYYMEDTLVGVNVNDTVQDAVKVMNDKKIGAVLVSEKGNFIGLFTETDLLRKVIAPGQEIDSVKMSAVMSAPLRSKESNASMVSAFILMQQYNIRHLAVTENKRTVGILSIKDIANYYVNKFRPK